MKIKENASKILFWVSATAYSILGVSCGSDSVDEKEGNISILEARVEDSFETEDTEAYSEVHSIYGVDSKKFRYTKEGSGVWNEVDLNKIDKDTYSKIIKGLESGIYKGEFVFSDNTGINKYNLTFKKFASEENGDSALFDSLDSYVGAELDAYIPNHQITLDDNSIEEVDAMLYAGGKRYGLLLQGHTDGTIGDVVNKADRIETESDINCIVMESKATEEIPDTIYDIIIEDDFNQNYY